MSTIVVIDADRLMGRQLSNIFDNADHQVATAATGKRGLEIIVEWQPDLIFVDLALPDMSERDAFDSIKRLAPRRL